MENSMNSMNKLSISCNAKSTDVDEESGWTMYFEDFYANNNNNMDHDIDHNVDGDDDDFVNNLSSASGYETSSLVSDAASSAAKKGSNYDHDAQKQPVRSPLGQSSKRLSFKKRKSTKGSVLVDDALEDTASSPVNSPKVSYLNEVMNMNPKEKRNAINNSQGKGSTCGQVDDARKGMDFIGRDSDCSELKKRGLCLVPLSVVANYLG